MLSKIEGASSSQAIDYLFDTLRTTETGNNTVDVIDLLSRKAVSPEELRDDIAKETSALEKQLILANFPNEKNNYLVVPKVIDE